jgi:hypothetical protein
MPLHTDQITDLTLGEPEIYEPERLAGSLGQLCRSLGHDG